MTETIPFPYKPVKAGEFRVLLLRSSRKPSHDIEYSLIREHLPPVHPYDALSYTWGADAATMSISLDGIIFPVRENLHCALKRLRYQDTDRRIWVDAICINQVDVIERNSQVNQMRTIYSNADQVAVWLGAFTAQTCSAIEFVPRLLESVSESG
ncbi:hypothetical protein DL98DRAFT_434531 [Cadophora sp. DSE1049]|nr:hypothetical protein DL98DRAFT_434531 [Cadophora sp. DSE1049]